MHRLNALILAAGLALSPLAAAAQQSTLRIGIAEDPDTLDPTLGVVFTVRMVLNMVCDKLFDLTPELEIVPRLAKSYEWSPDGLTLTLKLKEGVRFHDGEKFDAAAVKFSLERHLNLPGSFRKSEIGVIRTIDVVDDLTVKLNLSQPSAPLLSHFTDRAGMIISPKAAAALGDKFGTAPVCNGAYRFVERVAQDRIVLERFADYWDKDSIHVDRVVFAPIADGTVRAANLRSGQLDLIERVSPADLKGLRADKRVKTVSTADLGYHFIRFNIGNGPKGDTPLGKDPRVRAAFDAAIDRKVLTQVVFNDEFVAGNQFVSPQNPFYNRERPVPLRDLTRAKALMKEAGLTSYSFTLTTMNDPDWLQAAQVIQAMVAEAGFDMKILVQESATLAKASQTGDFEAALSFWGGRVDPDGNVGNHLTCPGPMNFSKYCSPAFDRLIVEARQINDPIERKQRYDRATALMLEDRASLYLWHRVIFTAYAARVQGFVPYPDGQIRMKGLRLGPAT